MPLVPFKGSFKAASSKALSGDAGPGKGCVRLCWESSAL